MKQYCRYCAFCVNGDAYYCTLKEELLRPSYVKHANRCKGYTQSSLGDVDSGRQYRPREIRKKNYLQMRLEVKEE